jgi:hypothetical protein
MSFVLWQLHNLITANSSDQHVLELVVAIPAGIATYLTILWLFKNDECRLVQQFFVSRRSRRGTSSQS